MIFEKSTAYLLGFEITLVTALLPRVDETTQIDARKTLIVQFLA